jgi:hypothetical protein
LSSGIWRFLDTEKGPQEKTYDKLCSRMNNDMFRLIENKIPSVILSKWTADYSGATACSLRAETNLRARKRPTSENISPSDIARYRRGELITPNRTV